jgi:hypothetical protein
MLANNQEVKRKPSECYIVSGDWEKQSKALIGRYPILTSKDVKFETGKETDLFERLVTKLNKNLNEIIYILKKNHEACC